MKTETRKNLIVALGVLLVSVVVLVLVWPESTRDDRWDDEAKQITIERARPIIQAIGAYRQTHGDEPETLQDLVPEFIEELPEPLVGGMEWEYHNTTRAYELSVPSSNPDPPSLIWMMIFGPSFDDRYFLFYPSHDKWEMADM